MNKKIFLLLATLGLLAAACDNKATVTTQPEVATTQPSANTSSTPTEATSPPAPASTVDSTAKVYTSDFNYKFSYPSSYIVNASNPREVSLKLQTNKTNVPDIKVAYFETISQLPHFLSGMNDLNDYVAKNGTDKIVANVESGNRNGNWVYMFSDNGLTTVYTELMLHNGHYYQISFPFRETADKLSVAENAFLKSFQFTK